MNTGCGRRASTPPAQATGRLRALPLRRVSEAAGRPGEIVAVTDEGFTVVAGLGGILVKRVCLEGDGKVAAKEFVDAHGIKAGTRLGE